MEHKVAGFALALGAVILLLWLAMRFCGVLKRILRDTGMELLTWISGLLLAAPVRVFVEHG